MAAPSVDTVNDRYERLDNELLGVVREALEEYLEAVAALIRADGDQTVLTAAIEQPDEARPPSRFFRNLLAVLRPELADILERSAGFFVDDYIDDQPAFDLSTEFVEDYLDDAINWWEGIEDTLWDDHIRPALQEGISEGDGIRRLIARLDLDDLAGSYVEALVRTEVTNAYNATQHATALQFELGNKTWLATGDSRTRPSHAQMNNETAGPDGTFEFPSGTVRWPGDRGGTASLSELVRCRCSLVYEENDITDATVTDSELTAAAESNTMQPSRPIFAIAQGVAGFAGVETDDGSGRMAGDVRLTTRELPRPLWTIFNSTHSAEPTEGPYTGDVTEMAIRQNARGEYRADVTVVFFDDEEGRLAAQSATGGLRGISMDPGGVFPTLNAAGEPVVDEDGNPSFEYRIGAITQVGIPAFEDAQFTSVTVLSDDDLEPDESGRARFVKDTDGKFYLAAEPVEVLRVREPAQTVPDEPQMLENSDINELVASAGNTYTAAGLRHPEPPVPMPITTFDDGTFAGHLAVWGVCHTGFKDRCVTAPSSASGYDYFHQSRIQTDEGLIRVGKFTVGTGHARKGNPRQTAAHYDNTGTTAAYGVATDTAIGIWVSGHLNVNASDAQHADFIESPQSGDWRKINGDMELIASLGVNAPGFPIPDAEMWLSSKGEQVGLTAAGIPQRDTDLDLEALHGWVKEHELVPVDGTLLASAAPSGDYDPVAARFIADSIAARIGVPTLDQQKQARLAELHAKVNG